MADRPARRATLIESLGVYLPPREVLTEELIAGCVTPTRFPLERMTGIRSRHVAGDTEFAIDLACQAVARCLAGSRHGPSDIDIVISTSIARCDGPGLWISYEPSAALELTRRFGFDRAIAFDVANACAGMFTGIAVVDALIGAGVVERGLVVSGEYISHLGLTAQKEITEPLDPRLACLTLGDSGAAVLLEATAAPDRGFDAVELATFGAHARYCMAYPTKQAHGGAIMLTDALRLTEAATRHGAVHALETLERAGWPADSFQHLILHQTSSTALASATREINRLLGRRVCHPENTVDNLARRGNTATTSHFIALADLLAARRVRPGDRVIFAVSASGLTVGTALYTFDDLPARDGRPPALRAGAGNGGRPARGPAPAPVRIAAVGTAPGQEGGGRDTLELLRRAATQCLAAWPEQRGELDLLIHAGVYRTDYVTEPAIATLLAGDLGINAVLSPEDGRRTLAFDVFNGAVGYLNACHIAAEMIRGGRADRAMVVTSEVENNAECFPEEVLGLEPAGSALILERSAGSAGFGAFRFRSFTEHADCLRTACTNRDATTWLSIRRSADLERRYLETIAVTVDELLEAEGLDLERIALVLGPQISEDFTDALAGTLRVPRGRLVHAWPGARDLFTSSLPFAFR
ncbi:MAG TPA: 3-oxoacyl-[acyl-carrier-protein] synthase III C-terminal domain-containing protein, partial [Gemmatimonadales bacterium]|nr:3-oxoacyl-[acyl-carrier-protein] synthase III C-terminal domain-containing protein [Gemmatimonadales bacterium]